MLIRNRFYCIALCLLSFSFIGSGSYTYKIAKVQYRGGGDWYANRTALPNLVKFCNQNIKTHINPNDAIVDIASDEIFDYPYIYLTGHGNIVFDNKDASNLRKYLEAGGFIHIDDNYGLDKYVRPQMKKVFPDLSFVELPYSHKIYSIKYPFPKGLPKIHEHDGKPAQGFGLIYKGRLVCFYSYESDLGNGWENPEVHNDPAEKRAQALKMGANIMQYALAY